MGRYRFRIAGPADDAALGRLLSETPMAGRIALRFAREPSFLAAAEIDGTFRQIAVCEDTKAQELVGFGTRSTRNMYVNGKSKSVGYLSTLRSREEVRKRGLLSSGYRFLKELHEDGRTRFYLSTIAEGNGDAMGVLTSARAGLPGYHDRGTLHTFALPVPRHKCKTPDAPGGLCIRPAEASDVGAIVDFLHRVGPSHQFFPDYSARDFFESFGTFRDLLPAQVVLAYQGDHLVGTLGGWDQYRFKQSIVERYSGALAWLRPVYNGWTWFRNLPRLPEPGENFRYSIGAIPLVEDNRRGVFEAVLDRLLSDLSGGDCAYLLIGLHADHEFVPTLRKRATTSYITRMFCVCWEDGEAALSELDGRIPYLELGCL